MQSFTPMPATFVLKLVEAKLAQIERLEEQQRKDQLLSKAKEIREVDEKSLWRRILRRPKLTDEQIQNRAELQLNQEWNFCTYLNLRKDLIKLHNLAIVATTDIYISPNDYSLLI